MAASHLLPSLLGGDAEILVAVQEDYRSVLRQLLGVSWNAQARHYLFVKWSLLELTLTILHYTTFFSLILLIFCLFLWVTLYLALLLFLLFIVLFFLLLHANKPPVEVLQANALICNIEHNPQLRILPHIVLFCSCACARATVPACEPSTRALRPSICCLLTWSRCVLAELLYVLCFIIAIIITALCEIIMQYIKIYSKSTCNTK
jgi:hypothetical protein